LTYVSILRGINVSGQKKIKMADLTRLYESLGLESVATYIQSGNIIFSSENNNFSNLKSRIEVAIEEHYGFHVPVDIRTHQELLEIIQNCPFKEAECFGNYTKVLVTFLQSMPSEVDQLELLSLVKPPEKLSIQGNSVYLFCPNGYGKSKLSNTFLERKLGVSATTRNWKTVLKLFELSQS